MTHLLVGGGEARSSYSAQLGPMGTGDAASRDRLVHPNGCPPRPTQHYKMSSRHLLPGSIPPGTAASRSNLYLLRALCLARAGFARRPMDPGSKCRDGPCAFRAARRIGVPVISVCVSRDGRGTYALLPSRTGKPVVPRMTMLSIQWLRRWRAASRDSGRAGGAGRSAPPCGRAARRCRSAGRSRR